MQKQVDVIVIGAGIAGASAAAELSAHGRVILLETEPQPGYHSTGRSAAYFAAAYGNSVVQEMTAVCESFFHTPPPGFTESQLIRPRGCLFIARDNQENELASLHAKSPGLKQLSVDATLAMVPILSREYIGGALFNAVGGDLDVNAMLQGYLRLFRQRGGCLATRQEVLTMERRDGVWHVRSGLKSFTAPVVVNAAGAWADAVAGLAGLDGLGLIPKRRTVILVDAPEGYDIDDWPFVLDVDEELYFKPDAGRLLICPGDETPVPACDVQPDELDVAIAVDRFETMSGLQIDSVTHRWAGLRTFAPDKTFVTGFDPRSDGFFWLAGQGGYGVQSAPGLAHLSTAIIAGVQIPVEYASLLNFVNDVAPDRLISH